jgi:hypothetical protein
LFDLRYHVASLAAVFLALIIGILVGVGIASQTSVSESDRQLLEKQLTDAVRDREAARADADLLRRQQEAGTSYIEESYPVVMNGRLRAVPVTLLFIGRVVPEIRDAVVQTLDDANGPPLARMRALELPVDAQAVRAALPQELKTLTLEEVGQRLGRELVAGGETPLWDALSSVIAEETAGPNGPEVEAVVVFDGQPLGERPSAPFLEGMYEGITGAGVPVAGVERTGERPSRINGYGRLGLSSTVDSIDSEMGRVALAVLLAGGEEGHYGLKPTADAVVPPIEPLQLAPLPGG